MSWNLKKRRTIKVSSFPEEEEANRGKHWQEHITEPADWTFREFTQSFLEPWLNFSPSSIAYQSAPQLFSNRNQPIIDFFRLRLRIPSLIHFQSPQVRMKARAKQFSTLTYTSPSQNGILKWCLRRGLRFNLRSSEAWDERRAKPHATSWTTIDNRTGSHFTYNRFTSGESRLEKKISWHHCGSHLKWRIFTLKNFLSTTFWWISLERNFEISNEP